MRTTGIAMTALPALCLGTTVHAQETMNGTIVTVDKAGGKIGIRFTGTVGSSDGTAPTAFKVQDGLMFNALKPGDRVSFVAERQNGVMTIKQITKD